MSIVYVKQVDAWPENETLQNTFFRLPIVKQIISASGLWRNL